MIDSKAYDQILGFDHPTISDDAYTNVDTFYKMLGPISFTKPVDVIGTSRGALVAKWLACDPGNTCFRVRKVLTFSGSKWCRLLRCRKKNK